MDAASVLEPDVVVHVGDFLYRQGPCPPNRECAQINRESHSPLVGHWGDTWNGWFSDFFKPSESLLTAAPWIVLRGNHEECDRGGHGFFIFLDPRPLPAGWTPQDCREYTEPYAIPFQKEQFIVIDDSMVSPAYKDMDDADFNCHCPSSQVNPYPVSRYDDPTQKRADIDSQISHYRGQFEKLWNFSKAHETNFLLSHRPVFAVACNGSAFIKMDWTLQQASIPETMDLNWGSRPPVHSRTLERISTIISGHMHWFEALQFQNYGLPTQLVVGNGGTKLIPNYMEAHEGGLVGLRVLGHQINRSAVNSRFGFTTMTRGEDDYVVKARHMVLRPAGAYRPFFETVLPDGLRSQEGVRVAKVIESDSEGARSESGAKAEISTLPAMSMQKMALGSLVVALVVAVAVFLLLLLVDRIWRSAFTA